MTTFEVHEFFLADGRRITVRARSEAQHVDGWYEELKQRAIDLQMDDEPMRGRGRAYGVYQTAHGPWLLVTTVESATAFPDGLVERDAQLLSSIEEFDSRRDVLQEVRSRMDPRDPDCPYSNLLSSWGYGDVASDAIAVARYEDTLL